MMARMGRHRRMAAGFGAAGFGAADLGAADLGAADLGGGGCLGVGGAAAPPVGVRPGAAGRRPGRTCACGGLGSLGGAGDLGGAGGVR
jgi:hypothetical protein